MSSSTERALIVVLFFILIAVVGGLGFIFINKNGGLFGPDDVAVFGEDTFNLCSQGSDQPEGSLPPSTKIFPIDEQAHSRQADIYNRLPASRLAKTRAELGAVLCVRSRAENIDSQTYYNLQTGNAVAGCVLERYVADLFLIDVNTRQTVAYAKALGPNPTVGCADRIKDQTVRRGDPISIDTLMQQVNSSILVFNGEEPPTAGASTAVAGNPTATAGPVAPSPATATTAAAATERAAAISGQASQIGKLVFTCSIGGLAQVFSMTDDGQNLTQLTRDRFNNYRPIWSPDGTQIAFHSNRAGNLEVYVMNADGSNLRRLTNNKGNDMSPTWAPDGKWIAFASNRGGSFDIYVVSAAGGTPKYLTAWASNETAPSWSADGSQIVFISNHNQNFYNVYRVRPDGSDLKQLTGLKKNVSGVTLSPDGTQMAFADSAGILVANSDGTGLKRVADTVGEGTDPGWSPDGSAVVYSSSIAGKHRIYKIEIDQHIPTQLTSSDMDCWQPNWTAPLPKQQ